jgi:two-component system chemotaxis sensor kinase CheA
MDIDQVLPTFISESRELLEEMEQTLLGASDGDISADAVNAIFRAAHTIKGSAGLFGLDGIVAFTHVVEGVLDRVRDGTVALDRPLIDLMLACSDHIGTLIEAVASGGDAADATLLAAGEPLLVRLREHLGASTDRALTVRDAGEFKRIATDRGDGDGDAWHLSVRFGREVLRNGLDPLPFIRYLGTMGTIKGIVTVADALPELEAIDPEACFLGFEIAFQSATADKAAIESVFEFVLDDCQLRIVPPHSRITDYITLIHAGPEDAACLGEMLVRCGTLTQRELEDALNIQGERKREQRIGEILVEQGNVEPAVVEAALHKQKRAKEHKALESQSVRVDAAKLDLLINQVGELIIAAASANLAARRVGNADLQECNATLSGLIENVRDSALQLRMVKIGATFSRFQRVVHDVARELGKDIGLAISGEDTELDKTVVEKIGDPLTHLVRNAMDHGIESPELRAQRGKPSRGTVSLNAFHDSGSIVIEVGDDGGGLNRDRILAKAIERGLVEPGKTLTDSEVFALVFEPGFSTAEQVTNLSGRGVGMDVVKRNIAALRGNVDIASTLGAGTTVTVRLPLTLAIINGFQVGVGRSVFVMPLEMVEECVQFSCEPGHDYTDLRGEVLPFVRLRELFDLPGQPGPRENIVVVKHANQKFGIVVDNLLGEAQTVIKPLSRLFGHVKGVSGSSILGSGEVALILDVPALFEKVERRAAPPSIHTTAAPAAIPA